METCCTVCSSYQCCEGQHTQTLSVIVHVMLGVCVCVKWSNLRRFFSLSLSKCAPIVAGSRFQGAHPQGGAAGTPRRERSTGSPRMTSGLKSTSLPGPHPPVRSEAPSPQRPGSEPGSTGSWAGRCPPPSLVWCLPPMSHKTEGQMQNWCVSDYKTQPQHTSVRSRTS